MFERSECAESETAHRAGDAPEPREVNTETVSKWCDYCDSPVATDEWYPVATRRDDDGDVEIYDFCDEECRKRWKRGEATD